MEMDIATLDLDSSGQKHLRGAFSWKTLKIDFLYLE